MKRTSVISPVLLLTIAAAVGAGYIPAEDPLRLIDPSNVQSLVSSVRSQRHAARHWLNQVVKHFGTAKQHQPHVTHPANHSPIITALATLHRYPHAHHHRQRTIVHHQHANAWLLNLPPPACL
ncbi:MAG: hypothetical protein CMJ19_03940 [Phycisphaeraceae bacterium]|nr:hypothetical protein [Phycisphaeraceae bacterium]